jgi:hypothetical protein
VSFFDLLFRTNYLFMGGTLKFAIWYINNDEFDLQINGQCVSLFNDTQISKLLDNMYKNVTTIKDG